jgi:probable selenate reductase FAD-binding subunit
MIEHFHRPASVREAVALLRKLKGKAAYLAGGTSVNSIEAMVHPQHAISLEDLGLDRVEKRAKALAIGACCTLQQLMDDRKVPAPLRAAIAQVVSRNVRNAATIGGHVAANMAQSDVLPMLVALGAKVVIAGAGPSKTVLVQDYVAKPVPGLVTTILLPLPVASRVAAARNVRGSANARSMVSVAVAVTVRRGVLSDPIVAVGGVAKHVVRVHIAESAMDEATVPDPDVLQRLVSDQVKPAPSFVAGAAIRRYEAGALVALALRDALAAKGGRS